MKVKIENWMTWALFSVIILFVALWLFDIINFKFIKPLLLIGGLGFVVIVIAIGLETQKTPVVKDIDYIYTCVNDILRRKSGGDNNCMIWSDSARLNYEKQRFKLTDGSVHECYAILTDTNNSKMQRRLIIYDSTDKEIVKFIKIPNKYESGNLWHGFNIEKQNNVFAPNPVQDVPKMTFNINKSDNDDNEIVKDVN